MEGGVPVGEGGHLRDPFAPSAWFDEFLIIHEAYMPAVVVCSRSRFLRTNVRTVGQRCSMRPPRT